MECGASGCACSALVLATKILPDMKRGKLKDVLFMGTGALLSQASVQQGKSIPGIAHLLRIQI
jgi:stage V sporulation protein AD